MGDRGISEGLLPGPAREAVSVGRVEMRGGDAKRRLQNSLVAAVWVWVRAASEPWVPGPVADWVLQWQMQRWGLGPASIEGRGE